MRRARHLARLLARLLHLGQIVEVTVPSVAQEAARDLVRAREDCRGDLMRARHRLSKLLLRQGIVYYGGKAWTREHERWLGRQHFDELGLKVAYREAFDARWERFDARDKRPVVANAAIARELAGWCWSLAVLDD
jgi:transposase